MLETGLQQHAAANETGCYNAPGSTRGANVASINLLFIYCFQLIIPEQAALFFSRL